MEKVWSIQYLRAVAALGVVAYHALQSGESRFPLGAAGVDVFFVISGFIMASLMMDREGRPGLFLRRRIIRIAPLYWAATFAALAVAAIKPEFFFRMDASAENAILSLLFLPHESRTGGVSPVLWQGWTLEYEMYFYALCTAALFLPARNRLRVLSGVLAALVALGVLWRPEGAIAHAYTSPLLLEFMAGVGLAAAWRRGLTPPAWVGATAIATGVAVYLVQHLGLSLSGYRVVDWGVPAMLIVAGALNLEANKSIVRSRAGLLLGDASYALYLTHGFVVAAFLWIVPDASVWMRLLACLPASAAVAIVVHRAFELPVTRWLNSRRLNLPQTAN